MKKYILRNAKYFAIQFTGDNRDKIIDALQIKKECCEIWRNEDTKLAYLLIKSPVCDLGRVDEREWLVVGCDKDNKFASYAVIPDVDFNEDFEELK